MKIRILLDDTSFRYDVHSLCGGFFPDMEVLPEDGAETADYDLAVRMDETSVTVNGERGEIPPGADRITRKNVLKRTVYRVLSADTGKTLPWGAMTGIRPVKVAAQRLAAGDKEEEICRYYREVYYTGREKASLAVRIAQREDRVLRGEENPEIRPWPVIEEGYSLYVGIPFCPTVCAYCSFSSGTVAQYRGLIPSYIAALDRELSAAAEMMRGKRLTTVYVGGGTPTALAPEQLREVLSAIRRHFPSERPAEFTVEAGRPDTITEETLGVIREAGADRICVNPQTMQQRTLDRLGRRHTVEDIARAFALVRETGFRSVNMDLIIGLPGEGAEDVRDTLRKVADLGPDALTVHALARKRASRFGEERIVPEDPGPEVPAAVSLAAEEMGMTPYYLYRQKNIAGGLENTGYAKEGHAGLYNILQMEEKQSVLSCGAGGVSKRVYGEGGLIRRSENVSDIRSYIDRIDEMISRKGDLFVDSSFDGI